MDSGFFNRWLKFSSEEKIAFRKKALIFSFFLLLSVIFWFLNALSKNYTTIIEYPVRYRNLPENKALVGELPNFLELKVTAHGYTLLRHKISSRYIPIVFNVRSFALNRTPSDSSFYYIQTRYTRDYISRQLSPEFEIQEIKPDTLLFPFADIVSKKIPVHLNVEYKLGQQLIPKQEPSAEPDSVLAFGPDYVIDTLDESLTRNIDLGVIVNTVDKTVALKKIRHISLEPNEVKVKIPVEKFTEKTMLVPIRVIDQPDSVSLKIFPQSISVTCQVGLSNYEKLQKSMFHFEVDYHDALETNSRRIQVYMRQQPDFVKSVKSSPKTVEFLIEK